MNRALLLVILVITICGCTGKKQIVQKEKKPQEISNDDYLLAFTEATKHALFGNYASAINIYNNLLLIRPENDAIYYQLSSIYMRVGDIETAKRYGKKAYDLDEKNVWYALHLANLYQYQEKLDSSAMCYERVNKLTDNLEYKYNLAILYSKISKGDEALRIIREIENEINESNEISYLKHNIYNNLHETDSAIYELKVMIEREPEKTENYGLLAEYLSEMKMNKESQEVYEEILKKDSLNGLLLLSYAEFLKLNKDYDQAQEYYIKAMQVESIDYETKLNAILLYLNEREEFNIFQNYLEDIINELKKEGGNFRVHAAAADYYIKRQNFEKAIDDLEECLKYDDKNIIVWEQFLYILSYEEEYGKLVENGAKADSIYPGEAGLAFYYAYGQHKLDNCKESIQILKSKEVYIKDKNLKIQYYNLLADNYRNLKEYDTSDFYYEKILEIDYENLMIRNNYSYYLSLRDKNLERAEELSRLTIKNEPNNATYLDTYGWILFRMNRVKEGMEYIEKAIKNGADNNPEVLDHYGDILYKMDRCKEAVEYWRKAMILDESFKNSNENKIEKSENCE